MGAGAAPTRSVEQLLWSAGHDVVVGIDEVGKGAWAGPLVVGAAVLPRDRRVNGVRDSKALTERQREDLFDRIAGWCSAWSIGLATHEECDELGMADAQRVAARRALDSLGLRADAAIVDGRWDFVGDMVDHVEMRVKADRDCLPVAAASVLAKVARDRLMRAGAVDYPWWSFDSNKGYPCHHHRTALQGYGPSAIHRRSWAFMDHFVPWTGVARVHRPLQPSLF